MGVTRGEIQNWLKTKHVDEEIATKSKDRVTRQLAERIKQNKPMESGSCNLCSRHSDKLVYFNMKVCPSCTRKYMQRGNGLRVLKREMGEFYCDSCLARGWGGTIINPGVCQVCAQSIGKHHKKHHEDFTDERNKNNQLKNLRRQGEI